MQPLPQSPASVTLAGGGLQQNGIEQELMLSPAWQARVPLKKGESARLERDLLCEPFVYAPSSPQQVYARAVYTLDGQTLCEVPMVAAGG